MPRSDSYDSSSGILLGTAGWSIPSAMGPEFAGEGSHLQRYAQHFSAVEVNSSFHRSHRVGTYLRWAAAVPLTFRFSVKLPKAITHVQRLVGVDDLLETFAREVTGLGEKLAVVLVQLPPSLAFDADVADDFLPLLRSQLDVRIVCEPRHPTWFTDEADACLAFHRVARVAADPVLVPGSDEPGGWLGLHYFRLHGSPRTYYSPYEATALRELAGRLRSADRSAGERWCIFDNTASGAATGNALELSAILDSHDSRELTNSV